MVVVRTGFLTMTELVKEGTLVEAINGCIIESSRADDSCEIYNTKI